MERELLGKEKESKVKAKERLPKAKRVTKGMMRKDSSEGRDRFEPAKRHRTQPWSWSNSSSSSNRGQGNRPYYQDTWMKKEDYDNYEPPADYSTSTPAWPKERSRPSRDSRGRGNSNKGGGRPLENLIPCDQCMALLGTNSSCDYCKKDGQTNLAKLRSVPAFSHLQVHEQPKLNGFIRPLLTAKGENCIAFEIVKVALNSGCFWKRNAAPLRLILLLLTLPFSSVVMKELCLMYLTKTPSRIRQHSKRHVEISKINPNLLWIG